MFQVGSKLVPALVLDPKLLKAAMLKAAGGAGRVPPPRCEGRSVEPPFPDPLPTAPDYCPAQSE